MESRCIGPLIVSPTQSIPLACAGIITFFGILVLFFHVFFTYNLFREHYIIAVRR